MNKKSTFCRYCVVSSMAFLAVSILIVHAQAAEQADVRVVAVMVVAPDGGKDNRSFCWKPGVTVSAMVTPAAGKIIKVNDSESKLDSFTDDKGTDLTAGPPSTDVFNKPGLSVEMSSSEQGESSVIMDLKATGQPAKGATVLNISGKVVAEIASQSKQFTAENVPLKTGSKFDLGDLPITISTVSISKNSFTKKDEFSVTISSAKDLKSISHIEFFDAQGNQIKAQKRSWGGGGILGYMIEYVLTKQIDSAKIVASSWQDLRTIEIPFTIKTGVGL